MVGTTWIAPRYGFERVLVGIACVLSTSQILEILIPPQYNWKLFSIKANKEITTMCFGLITVLVMLGTQHIRVPSLTTTHYLLSLQSLVRYMHMLRLSLTRPFRLQPPLTPYIQIHLQENSLILPRHLFTTSPPFRCVPLELQPKPTVISSEQRCGGSI